MDMQQSSFYVVLPSNVKTQTGKNTTSQYITPLPRALELPSHNWEVALVEINYPYSFYNVLPPHNHVTFGKQRNEHVTVSTTEIPSGFYRSLNGLVEAINNAKPRNMTGFLKKTLIRFDKEDDPKDGVAVHLAKKEYIHFRPKLAHMLGLRHSRCANTGEQAPSMKTVKSSFPPSLGTDLYNLYVYSNIVKETLVGDSLVPLLRTVSVRGRNGDYITKTFETPHYLPLASDFIQHIEIKITDDLGENIKFRFGKVIVKLHFRRKPRFSYA